MEISASNSAIVEDQRNFLFGLIGLTQTDVENLVTIAARMRTDEQFNEVVRNGYSDILSSYGYMLSVESKEFYNRLRQENGGTYFDGRLPGRDGTYDQRRNASINVNTSLKYASGVSDLRNRLARGSVKDLNEYSFATVDHIGKQDSQFTSIRRVPRANACAFCRWKAYEFSVYTRASDLAKLDAVKLHDYCRCVAAPGFKFTDSEYLNTSAQNLFKDRFNEFAEVDQLNPQSGDDLKDLLSMLREEYKYR